MQQLRRFYDIAVAAGRPMPPWEHWGPTTELFQREGKIELWPIHAGGQMVGGVMFAGDTLHIAVLPEWHGRWVTRAMRRAYDTWTHAVDIRAPIRHDNGPAIRLATRLGFKFQQDQGLYHLYVKEANA